jgi:hypothetical protein
VVQVSAHATSPILDGLAITILAARICQSIIHVLFDQTNIVAGVRFAFYFAQVLYLIAMGALIAMSAHA